ncbi:MAG: HAMP domain-containing sensor histidine kinase [Planctomycetota bacterium]
MIRRISTKWVLAVLATVVVPFAGFAWYVNGFVRARIADDVVRYHLLSHAAELAERLDREVEERKKDVQVLANVREVILGLDSDAPAAEVFAESVRYLFDSLIVGGGAYDYLLLIAADGTVRCTSAREPGGEPLSEVQLAALVARPWSSEPWFARALANGEALLDWTRLDLEGPPAPGATPEATDYHVGFAHRVGSESDPRAAKGVVLGLMCWDRVQREIENYGVRRQGAGREGLLGADIFRSSYAWVWGADADTILAHQSRALYGQRVSGPSVGLPQMTQAARSARAGMYPNYAFRGVEKKAAFQRTRTPEEGGFGWVVGVGVDFSDIYRPVRTLTATLVKATIAMLVVSALITLIVARRTTRPIQELQRFTRQVALGDLDVQVPAGGQDELGDLARSFNRMTRELKENRQQLVRAEKDAAWREMARQVAHEIKNPLTPLRLSADLLERAHADHSPEFEQILERTIGIVRRQCDHMREIAKDFHAFAGRHHDLCDVDVAAALEEVLALHEAWARSAGVEVVRSGGAGVVRADADELRRALINLVSNALEAMPDGGRLEVDVETQGERVIVELRDTGSGLPPELQARLFEPYFTTRSSGTGLGLAIVRRIIEDLGGEVSLQNRTPGPGAVVRLSLPRHAPAV